jgi:hypothetical protein
MKSMLFPLAAILASLLPAPAFAADAGSEAIAALGRVNGMALACQQPAIASRARNAMTTTAPKTRSNGEAFENATNAAYLEQGKGGACPAAGELAAALGSAEKNLQAAFATAR